MGFYEELYMAIAKEVDKKKPSLLSQLRLNADVWWKHVAKLEAQICLDSNFWFEYWLSHETSKPESKDLEHLKALNDDRLNAFQLVLAVSLKHLILNGHGSIETARNLNEYWLIGNAELKRRGFRTLPFNPYEVDMKAMAEGKIIELTKEQSQTLGICPKCQSKKHVISNGSMWKCKKCGRNFRKKSQLSFIS